MGKLIMTRFHRGIETPGARVITLPRIRGLATAPGVGGLGSAPNLYSEDFAGGTPGADIWTGQGQNTIIAGPTTAYTLATEAPSWSTTTKSATDTSSGSWGLAIAAFNHGGVPNLGIANQSELWTRFPLRISSTVNGNKKILRWSNGAFDPFMLSLIMVDSGDLKLDSTAFDVTQSNYSQNMNAGIISANYNNHVDEWLGVQVYAKSTLSPPRLDFKVYLHKPPLTADWTLTHEYNGIVMADLGTGNGPWPGSFGFVQITNIVNQPHTVSATVWWTDLAFSNAGLIELAA